MSATTPTSRGAAKTPEQGSFRACLAAARLPGHCPRAGAASEGREAGSSRPRPMRRPVARAGAERVLRWWSLGEASAHVDGAQMMGKPGVAFRKARCQRPCLPDAMPQAPH